MALDDEPMPFRRRCPGAGRLRGDREVALGLVGGRGDQPASAHGWPGAIVRRAAWQPSASVLPTTRSTRPRRPALIYGCPPEWGGPAGAGTYDARGCGRPRACSGWRRSSSPERCTPSSRGCHLCTSSPCWSCRSSHGGWSAGAPGPPLVRWPGLAVVVAIAVGLCPLPWMTADLDEPPGTAWRLDGRLTIDGERIDPSGVLVLVDGRSPADRRRGRHQLGRRRSPATQPGDRRGDQPSRVQRAGRRGGRPAPGGPRHRGAGRRRGQRCAARRAAVDARYWPASTASR